MRAEAPIPPAFWWRRGLALYAGGLGCLLAGVSALSNPRWLGLWNETHQELNNRSIDVATVLLIGVIVDCRRLTRTTLLANASVSTKRRFYRSMALAYSVTGLSAYALLALILLPISAARMPLRPPNPALLAHGAAFIVAVIALGIALARLPLIVGVPSGLVLGFLMPLALADFSDSRAGLLTPVSNAGLPPMLRLSEATLWAQAGWTTVLAGIGILLACGGVSARVGTVALGAGAVATVGLLGAVDPVRAREVDGDLLSHSCSSGPVVTVCVVRDYARLADPLRGLAETWAQVAPAGSLPRRYAPGEASGPMSVSLQFWSNPWMTDRGRFDLALAAARWRLCASSTGPLGSPERRAAFLLDHATTRGADWSAWVGAQASCTTG